MVSLYLHCGEITSMADLGVDEGEKAWSPETVVHACDNEVIYLDRNSGEEVNLKLKVISEVKIYRKLWAWIKWPRSNVQCIVKEEKNCYKQNCKEDSHLEHGYKTRNHHKILRMRNNKRNRKRI